MTGQWYEAADDFAKREALTLGVASNATLPGGELADVGRDFILPQIDLDEDVIARASTRRAAVAATYLSIGISEDPHDLADAAPQRLVPGSPYWLWITLGPPVSEGVGTDLLPIRPEALSGVDEVVVALFADEGVTLSADSNAITFRSDGVGHFTPIDSGVRQQMGHDRAWIAFQAPPQTGTWFVRCGVFVRGVLVHVETLNLAIGSSPETCAHTTTFRTLNDSGHSQLDRLEAPTLTIYANQTPSSMDVSFYAPGELHAPSLVAQAAVESGQAGKYLEKVRSLLSKISYGSDKPHTTEPSRYPWSSVENRYTSSFLDLDVCRLAKRGRVLWRALLSALEARGPERTALRTLMRQPGTVEMVLKGDARYVLPAQVFYDHPLDTTTSPRRLLVMHQIRGVARSTRWRAALYDSGLRGLRQPSQGMLVGLLGATARREHTALDTDRLRAVADHRTRRARPIATRPRDLNRVSDSGRMATPRRRTGKVCPNAERRDRAG